ncbi:hypothetical protein W822_19365 [Advenella kashmirensis W13003]|uniref:Uncharacterized protein n=1 Tax=Advenella kashmirensis W13003 TaxID=1424334 RepID=V8QML6_9BURK|nr:hypothetical protein W822_19365 [Advenella kashmirensis W13003]
MLLRSLTVSKNQNQRSKISIAGISVQFANVFYREMTVFSSKACA